MRRLSSAFELSLSLFSITFSTSGGEPDLVFAIAKEEEQQLCRSWEITMARLTSYILLEVNSRMSRCLSRVDSTKIADCTLAQIGVTEMSLHSVCAFLCKLH